MTGVAERGTAAQALRWQRMKVILADALELPAEQQQAFLQRHAGDAEELLELQALRAAGHAESRLLDAGSGVFLAEAVASRFGAGWLGHEVGRYRLVELIARGGMGQVYRAEQLDGSPGPDVAVKLMRDGLVDGALASRFLAERQILARLEHPHLARLLDGGVADGVPYLVMELVRGVPIDVYCRHHELTLVQRIELFRTLCHAVHYAHGQGVVHRDLKPDNVLVTDQGDVKLVDFGIAKNLGDPLVAGTATTVRVMTLACASPEQVRGQKITPASDVYSLGVLLYQLLTGRTPYRLDDCADDLEVRKAICETPPLRPSLATAGAVRRALKGSLDVVVMKALSKEPAQRHASAQALSEDLRRYMESLLAEAQRQRLGRTASFAHRNPRVWTGAWVAAVLMGLGGLWWGWHAWSEATRKASVEMQLLTSARNGLEAVLVRMEAEQEPLGSAQGQQALVRMALGQVSGLAAKATGADAALHAELGRSHLRIARVQGGPQGVHLDDRAGAMRNYGAAVAAVDRAVHLGLTGKALRQARHSRAAARGAWARLLAQEGRPQEARVLAGRALVEAREVSQEDPSSWEGRWLLASTQLDMAHTLSLKEEGPAMEDSLQSSRDLLELMHEERPSDGMVAQALADNHVRRGQRFLHADLPAVRSVEQAASAFEKGRGLLEILLQAQPRSVHLQLDLALVHRHLGEALWRAGRSADALVSGQRARDLLHTLWKGAPDQRLLQLHWAEASQSLGELLLAVGSADRAVQALAPAVLALDALEPGLSGDRRGELRHASARYALGKALMERTPVSANALADPIPPDWSLACNHFRRSLERLQPMQPRWTGDPLLSDATRVLEMQQVLHTCPSA